MGKTMLWFAFKNSPNIGLARNYDQICCNHLLFKICSGQNYLFLYVMFILYSGVTTLMRGMHVMINDGWYMISNTFCLSIPQP